MGFLKIFGSKESGVSDEKDQREEVKSIFLSEQHKVIHDLKTPLNGVSGMTQLLRETPLDKEQAEYVSVIEESVVAMLEQINTLMGRREDGSPYKAVEIRGFLQHILALMRQEVKAHEFGIHYKIDRKFPVKLMLEKDLLEEIMMLAFKKLFAIRKKDLVIEAAYESDDGYGLIILRDKSLVVEDELTTITEVPFSEDLLERLDASSLRFSLMKTIDGKVRLEVYAYYQQEATEELVSETRELSSALIEEIKDDKSENYTEAFKKDTYEEADLPTILIAEDEVVGRVTLKLMLKDRYNIIFAKNGKEAVDLYFKKNPCLVLMDIMMPLMNGFEAFDQIEKRDKSRRPIIACTSKVISTEREYLTSYGFDDHLDKPIEHKKLDEILMKYTDI
jgi:CheY-like chemotaxis protein